jgi:hypothetical protein
MRVDESICLAIGLACLAGMALIAGAWGWL